MSPPHDDSITVHVLFVFFRLSTNSMNGGVESEENRQVLEDKHTGRRTFNKFSLYMTSISVNMKRYFKP